MDLSLIIQIIAGIVGGNSAAAASKQNSLGTLGNSITGLLGGVGGGQLLGMLIPALSGAGAASGTGGGIESMVGQLAGGGVGGAVLTIIVGIIKQKMMSSAAAKS